MEPYNLRPWRLDAAPKGEATFYTCARPGRAAGPDGMVEDHTVSMWVEGLPGPNKAIISLLGRKDGPKGVSEFSYYSFRGGMDTASERKGRMTFRQWLGYHHKNLGILLREHPTYDWDIYNYLPIPPLRLAKIAEEVRSLLSDGRTVVVMDSAGIGRTKEVCGFLKATPV